MTCIVGLVDAGTVFIGGDSAGVGGWDLTTRSDSKVFRNGEFIFGFTSSFRMGQLLCYSLRPPDRHPNRDPMAYMAVEFINAVRECLKAGGYATKTSEAEKGGTFLVGYAGRLFLICDDYQVAESAAGYDACGCGESFAKGAMFANKTLPPEERLKQALLAAETHSAGVRGPFHIESLSP